MPHSVIPCSLAMVRTRISVSYTLCSECSFSCYGGSTHFSKVGAHAGLRYFLCLRQNCDKSCEIYTTYQSYMEEHAHCKGQKVPNHREIAHRAMLEGERLGVTGRLVQPPPSASDIVSLDDDESSANEDCPPAKSCKVSIVNFSISYEIFLVNNYFCFFITHADSFGGSSTSLPGAAVGVLARC